MIQINSMAVGLAARVNRIYDELKATTDEKQIQSLNAELEIKRDLLGRMLAEARPVKRKGKQQ